MMFKNIPLEMRGGGVRWVKSMYAMGGSSKRTCTVDVLKSQL